ncbi:hypothetical protein ACXR2U_02005 [Jatrophihabitans sp. YIM 134969]
MERSADDVRFDRACYVAAAVLVVSGLLAALGWLIVGGPWDGPVSLRKALTFGLAFGVTVATVTWLSTQLGTPERTRRRLVGVFTAACGLEVLLVSEQAWRGVPSHFNRDTTVDSVVSTVLAAGGGVIVVCALVLARAVVRMPATVPALMRLAIRAGFAGFLLALGAGIAMVVRGVTLGDSAGATAAYDGAGAFKPVHATTMHAILVLPVIAWLLLRSGWERRTQRRLLWAAIAGYALTTAVVLVDTVAGVEPFAARAAVVVAMVAGGLVTAGVGAAALVGGGGGDPSASRQRRDPGPHALLRDAGARRLLRCPRRGYNRGIRLLLRLASTAPRRRSRRAGARGHALRSNSG